MVVDFPAGTRLTAARLGALPKGIIARARRDTNTAIVSAETGVLRLDGVPIRNGRVYRIYTNQLVLDGDSTGDVGRASIRVSTAGPATTSSTLLGVLQLTVPTPALPWGAPMSVDYYPTADGTLSVLLTISRLAGTGTGVRLLASEGIDLTVEDMGLDPGNTGINL